MKKGMAGRPLFFSKTEKLMAVFAGILMLAAVYFIFDDSLLITQRKEKTETSSIGVISGRVNDTRYKENGDFSWNPTQDRQFIQAGDSVFTGVESSAQVTLKEGQQISMGENTLVVFQDFPNNGKKSDSVLGNLTHGNFRLKVNGKMKIAIQGKVTEIDGDHSDIQLVLDKKKPPKIKLLRGTAHLKESTKAKAIELPVDRVIALEKPVEREVTSVGPEPAEPPALPVPPQIIPSHENSVHHYIEKLTDYYDQSASNFTLRRNKPIYVRFPVTVRWGAFGDVKNIYGQHSFNAEFDKSVFEFSTAAEQNEVTLQNVFIGRNFWRLSADTQNWGETIGFEVQSGVLPLAPPSMHFTSDTLELPEQGGRIVSASIRAGDPSLTRFVVDLAKDPTFPVESTRVRFDDQKKWTYQIAEAGQYYIRVRGLNAQNQITAVSDVTKLTVVRRARTEMIEAPLAKAERKPRRKVAAVESEKTETAAEATTTTALDSDIPTYLNKKYNYSHFVVEGVGFTMFSREQINNYNSRPYGTEVALRSLSWMSGGPNGIEAMFKSKVGGDSSTKPMGAEVRYHRRWSLPWNIFSSYKQSQISLILGYEYYRNSGAGYFAPKYDLIKSGFAVNFPLFSRWDTGGEMLYGLGLEKSQKMEMSGHLNYYLTTDWSMGGGYRVHLFEAGSDATAPAGIGVPFREAYGEIFSSLIYRY